MERCTLAWLRMQHNKLGDEGVTALASALANNQSLTHLQLRDVGVGQSGSFALADAVRRHPALLKLGLEQNNMHPEATEKLLHAMQGSKLSKFSLDADHGGVFDRVQTRSDLSKQMTLAFLGLGSAAAKAKKQSEKEQARSYVGPLGVANPFGSNPLGRVGPTGLGN